MNGDQTPTTPTTQPQQPDYASMVHVVGPDNKKYLFPKGTTKEQAVNYFRTKGIKAASTTSAAAAPAAAPATKEGFFQKLSRQTGAEAQRQMNMAAGPEAQNKNLVSRAGHAGLATLASAEEVSSDIANGIFNLKNVLIGATGAIHPAIPLGYFGKQGMQSANAAFDALRKEQSPENVKNYLEALSIFPMLAAGAKADTPHAVDFDKIDMAGTLRKHAAELDTKVLQTADAAAKDYKTNVALEVANRHIVGTLRSLPEKIETARKALDIDIKRRVTAADQSGTTVDIRPGLTDVINEAVHKLNEAGTLDKATKAELKSLIKQLTTKNDLTTGNLVSRNLAAMKPSEVMALIDHNGLLSQESEFNKARPDAVNNIVRRMRAKVNENFGKQLPDVQKLRSEESRLITARDAARNNFEQALNDKHRVARGLLYGSAGTMAVYFGLRGIGVSGVIALSVVPLMAIAKSTPSRTLRAALYARAASLVDHDTMPGAGATGPQEAPGAMSGPYGPTGPQTIVPQGVTGKTLGTGAAPGSPPFIDAEVVSTNEPPSKPTRGTMLPEKASRAKAGSGDYVRPEAQPQAKPQAQAKPDNVAQSNTKTAQAAQARQAAMRQRLDSLLSREPKNAMDAAIIRRQINEIKRVLSGEASKEETAKAAKHIRDSERLANQRAEAAAKATPTQMASGEPVSPSASPELRAQLMELGYRKLATYENGPQYVKQLQAVAKEMAKHHQAYDEASALAEAIKALEEIKNMPKD